jgi:predicted DNA-binding protein with PD1-like motif
VQSKLLHQDGERTYALVFDTGDEVVGELRRFAREEGLTASHFTALGAFREVTLGYFDLAQKEYLPIEIAEQVEVVSLVGDVALADEQPQIHAHVVVAKRDGTAHGGHLLRAYVRPTLELVLVESPAFLRREYDPATGLALIKL